MGAASDVRRRRTGWGDSQRTCRTRGAPGGRAGGPSPRLGDRGGGGRTPVHVLRLLIDWVFQSFANVLVKIVGAEVAFIGAVVGFWKVFFEKGADQKRAAARGVLEALAVVESAFEAVREGQSRDMLSAQGVRGKEASTAVIRQTYEGRLATLESAIERLREAEGRAVSEWHEKARPPLAAVYGVPKTLRMISDIYWPRVLRHARLMDAHRMVGTEDHA